MRKGLILLMVVAAAALFISGCVTTTGSETTTGPETTMSKASKAMAQGVTVGIGSGSFHEVCEDEWKVGDTVKVSFTSSKPVVFNVHYHDAKEVKHYSIKDMLVDDFSANFTVENKYIHCGSWQNNSGNFVKLTYEIKVVNE